MTISINIKNLQLLNGKRINLSLEDGTKYLLKGQSGVGKSLLLKQMVLLYPTKFDQYLFFDKNIDSLSISKLRSLMIYLPQKPSFEKEKVIDIFNRPFLFQEHLGKKIDIDLLKIYLEKFELSQNFLNTDSKKLSGGQEQIVQLIRALLLNPKVILIDEGLSALDESKVKTAEKILNQFVGIILMVSHHQSHQFKAQDLSFSKLQI